MDNLSQQINKCSNCGSENTGNFCASCGQEFSAGRLNVKRLFMDWLGAFYNYSGGILFTFRMMALKPGIAVKEYIEGKTRNYWNPFNYFVITLTVYMFIGIKSGILRSESSFESFTNDYAAYLIMISIPFISAASYLLFRRSGINYAENLVLNIFVNAQINIYNTFLFLLNIAFTSKLSALITIFPGFIYEIFVYSAFFRQNIFITTLKLLLINFLKVIILVIILVISYIIAV